MDKDTIERIIRVNHAGEYGAKRIYAGQMAVLKDSPSLPLIAHMAAQEQVHLDYFSEEIIARRVRPTALFPLWHVAGYMLGAATALLGEKTAMACTVAVEEAIDEHYAAQLNVLEEEEEAGLREKIAQFRAEELEHKNTALEHKAEEAPAYMLLKAAIKQGSKAAIWLASRV